MLGLQKQELMTFFIDSTTLILSLLSSWTTKIFSNQEMGGGHDTKHRSHWRHVGLRQTHGYVSLVLDKLHFKKIPHMDKATSSCLIALMTLGINDPNSVDIK